MLRIRNAVFALAALAVTACGPMDAVTRSAPFENTMPKVPAATQSTTSFDEAPEIVSRSIPELVSSPQAQQQPSYIGYNIVDVIVDVPRTLIASEANTLIPNADIVWQEEERGDRHAQVEAIMLEAMELGAKAVEGDRDVVLWVEVTKFHALTKTARLTLGGGHRIQFEISLIDPETGLLVVPAWAVDASFAAYGGAAAIIAERAGLTQKVRIQQHLVKVIYEELGGDVGEARLALAN